MEWRCADAGLSASYIQALKLCMGMDMDVDMRVCATDPLPIHTIRRVKARVDGKAPT
jgi:hypothetical protein